MATGEPIERALTTSLPNWDASSCSCIGGRRGRAAASVGQRRTVNRRAARDGLGGGVDEDDTWGQLVSEMVMKFEGRFTNVAKKKDTIQSCLYA